MTSPRTFDPPGLVTSVVTDDAGFKALAAEWDALLDESDQQVFFLRWSWNWAWWQHVAPRGARLRLLVCRDATGVLQGIGPFYVRPRRVLGRTYAWELALLGTGIELKSSEYGDLFSRRGLEAAVARSMASCLRQLVWDRASFVRVPHGSQALPALLADLGATVTSHEFEDAPYIDTSVSWSDYRSSLGRSMRRNVEYYARRLSKTYQSHFALASSVEDVEAAFDHLERLHQARWQAAGQPGTFASPAVRAFIRDAVLRSHAEGRLRLWTLTLDGTVEAALVGFVDRGTLHYFQKGFNPQFAKDDLGTAMLSLCVRACFDDPEIRAFDFLSGGAPYKRLWAREARPTMVHEVRRGTIGGHVHVVLEKGLEIATTTYRAVVPIGFRTWRLERIRRRRARLAGAIEALTIAFGTLATDTEFAALALQLL